MIETLKQGSFDELLPPMKESIPSIYIYDILIHHQSIEMNMNNVLTSCLKYYRYCSFSISCIHSNPPLTNR